MIFVTFQSALGKCRHPALAIRMASGFIEANMTIHADAKKLAQTPPSLLVATPGRLNDLLANHGAAPLFSGLQTLIFDEADQLLEMGFRPDVLKILAALQPSAATRQTLLFSATMPNKIQAVAKSALVNPVVVNVGRAGAANLDVIQEVEYVKQEAKMVYLLECPPEPRTVPPQIPVRSRCIPCTAHH